MWEIKLCHNLSEQELWAVGVAGGWEMGVPATKPATESTESEVPAAGVPDHDPSVWS